MVCYAVPLIATLLLLFGRKAKSGSGNHGFWLNIMMLGGALFGLIDHAWHGELFLISANWTADLALGGFITLGITAGWGFLVLSPKINHSLNGMACRLGFLKRDVGNKTY